MRRQRAGKAFAVGDRAFDMMHVWIRLLIIDYGYGLEVWLGAARSSATAIATTSRNDEPAGQCRHEFDATEP